MISKDYRDYVQDVLDAIADINDFVGTMSFEEFVKDKKTVNAVLRSIEIMGEAAKNIPQPIRSKYPGVPWKKMAGTRDKLIHEYSGVDLEIIWNLIKYELVSIRPEILKIMDGLNRA
jgi:uncharacterized protein with HEPN domain